MSNKHYDLSDYPTDHKSLGAIVEPVARNRINGSNKPMNNPITCLECGKTVEQNSMKDTEGKLCYHNYVCAECYENLENDDWDCRNVCS